MTEVCLIYIKFGNILLRSQRQQSFKHTAMRKSKLRLLVVAAAILVMATKLQAQVTFPVNGVADPREGCYAFTNATIVKDGQSTLTNATMLIRDGKIISIGTSVTLPKDAVIVNCSGKYIYPSLIDIYSDY